MAWARQFVLMHLFFFLNRFLIDLFHLALLILNLNLLFHLLFLWLSNHHFSFICILSFLFGILPLICSIWLASWCFWSSLFLCSSFWAIITVCLVWCCCFGGTVGDSYWLENNLRCLDLIFDGIVEFTHILLWTELFASSGAYWRLLRFVHWHYLRFENESVWWVLVVILHQIHLLCWTSRILNHIELELVWVSSIIQQRRTQMVKWRSHVEWCLFDFEELDAIEVVVVVDVLLCWWASKIVWFFIWGPVIELIIVKMILSFAQIHQ